MKTKFLLGRIRNKQKLFEVLNGNSQSLEPAMDDVRNFVCTLENVKYLQYFIQCLR